MSTKLLQLKETFLSKQNQLEIARKTLKKEFFGIDKAIDELINNTRSWYVLSDFQERPTVVNLWGLTGVGKTSLVKRMMELLSCSDNLYHYDMGNKSEDYSFIGEFGELLDRQTKSPRTVAIILDEFQQGRTLRAGFIKTDVEDENRIIWELMDTGKLVDDSSDNHKIKILSDLEKFLRVSFENGLVVEKGIVVKGAEQVNKALGYLFKIENGVPLFNEFWQSELRAECSPYSNLIFYGRIFENTEAFETFLLSLNGDENLTFIQSLIFHQEKRTVVDFSKAIIFVIGNLDEAYEMSNNLTADIDADAFCEASLKITLPQIKNALTERFRVEQIARLGNNHIIYPALSKQAYKSIIALELDKLSEKLSLKTDLMVQFDASIYNIIYKEGVFPTQGARPILTTINSLVKAHISQFLTEILTQNLVVSHLHFSIKRSKLICEYFNERELIYTKSETVLTPLENLRKTTNDDQQAIVAVHESGHATLSAILLRCTPEQVCSITTDGNNNGFVFTKFPWKYVSKQEIMNRVAMFLGGFVAEELIFGKEHVTAGASSDIRKMTSFLTRMYKESGFGEIPIYYHSDLESNIGYHNCESVEEAIKNTIEVGYELAKSTLQQEMKLLLVMANYLSDHSCIEKETLKNMINTYKVSDLQLIENGDFLYYRNHLKSKLSSDVSEKKNKQWSNRALRRLVNQRISVGNYNLPALREVSNIWDFAKDGKLYIHNPDKKLLRK